MKTADYQSFLQSFAWVHQLNRAYEERMVQVLALLNPKPMNRVALLSQDSRKKIHLLLEQSRRVNACYQASVRATIKQMDCQKPLQIEAWTASLTLHDQENFAEFLSQQHIEMDESLRCMATHYGYGSAKRPEGFYFVAHLMRIFDQAQKTHQTHREVLKAFRPILLQERGEPLKGSEKFATLMAHCNRRLHSNERGRP